MAKRVRHPQLIWSGGSEVAFDEIGRGCGLRLAPRGARPFPTMAPLQPSETKQTRHPLARTVDPFVAQLGPDAGHPIRATTALMDDANPLAQGMIRLRPCGRWSQPPRVVAAR